MEPIATTLAPFPSEGNSLRASWSTWELQVLDFLDAATSSENGLLGFAMNAAQYEALAGLAPGEVHAPRVRPAPLGANPTTAQIAAHKYATDLYDSEQRAVKGSKTQILAALNPEALSLLTEPIFGTRRHTIRVIMDTLRTEYGTLTAADLIHQKALLLVPFRPATPIRDYIRIQREVHLVCEGAGQPLTAADTVAALRNGVKHVPVMASAIQHFVNSYPAVANQTFELLATMLGQAEDNGEPEPTTGTAGYAAAITTPAEPPMTTATLTHMIAEAVTLALTQHPPARGAGRAGGTRGVHYCWTHGPGGHPSQDCRAPAHGHVPTATERDRRGGATSNPRFNKK